jgi:hypothetical protein
VKAVKLNKVAQNIAPLTIYQDYVGIGWSVSKGAALTHQLNHEQNVMLNSPSVEMVFAQKQRAQQIAQQIAATK